MLGHFFKLGFNPLGCKNILLLQGPNGPFFKRLAEEIKKEGAFVVKVNLNGGDFFFYPGAQYNFKGQFNEWENFLENIISTHKIDTVLIFGQNRIYHEIARNLTQKHKIDLGVFEEGYMRPHYVTFEKGGVNLKSKLSKDPLFYLQQPAVSPLIIATPVEHAFLAMAWCASLYYLMASLLKPFYKHYRHHRKLSLTEALPWIKAIYRRYLYAFLEKNVLKRLIESHDQAYFLVPLQVHNDAQIREFDKLDDTEHFIKNTMYSFSKFAPKENLLVLKHHPLDRGYRDYKNLINDLSHRYKLTGRVMYVHDLHLPTLLKHARGVIVINSTSGMQALHHQVPTLVLGDTPYNLRGLTYQKPLHQFWKEAHKYVPDPLLYQKFSVYLIEHTQLNGSFYTNLKTEKAIAGLEIPRPPLDL